jgi:hypothetical protein
MLSEQEEAVREQQQKQRREGTTFFQHAQAHNLDVAGGRYGAAMGAPRVIGSTAMPAQYPAASPHQSDPAGTEPPLGYDVNEMVPLEPSTSNPVGVEDTGAPEGATSLPLPQGDGESGDAGAPLFSPEQTNE